MRFLRLRHNGDDYYARLLDDATAQLWTDAPWLGGKETSRLVPIQRATILAPVMPSKIVAVGRNYAAHAAELGNDVPADPLLFVKVPTTVIGPEATVLLPEMSQQVEHEGEFAIVIGTELRHVSEDDVTVGIFGYTCANDVTARDIQRAEGKFTRAKNFDSFLPCGPWIETDLDPADQRITVRVNGEVRQDDRTSNMVHSCRRLVSFISSVMSLCPGDVILTGTPAGVGPLRPGDVVEVDIDGIGRLRNSVAAGR